MKELSENESKTLFDAPIFFGLLGALHNKEISKTEMDDAEMLVHLRTYTSDSILHEFYENAEVDFKSRLDNWKENLPVDADEAIEFLKKKVNEVEIILQKQDERFRNKFVESMKSFSKHVASAEHNWWEAIPMFNGSWLGLSEKE